MLLQGKIALITGASRGIGKSIAAAFAAHGARLVVTASSEELETVAGELSAGGASVCALRGDINQDTHVRELARLCRSAYGGLDVLVNNAGVYQQAPLGMIALDAFRRMLDTNLVSMMNLTQYAVRLMANSQCASIINLASIAGTHGIPGAAAYSASKAAVCGFTLAAAKELAPKRIRVNAIAPGFIDTGMTRGMPEENFQKGVAAVRMGRIGTPQDVAGVAVCLASDLFGYVTGQTIGVDGGMAV